MGPAPAQIAARSILRACRADLAAEEAAAAVPWLCASGAAPSCSSENAERCTAMVVPTGNTCSSKISRLIMQHEGGS